MIVAKFPSFEEAYKVGNRFWPMRSTEIREVVSWDKVKEIVLAQASAKPLTLPPNDYENSENPPSKTEKTP